MQVGYKLAFIIPGHIQYMQQNIYTDLSSVYVLFVNNTVLLIFYIVTLFYTTCQVH